LWLNSAQTQVVASLPVLFLFEVYLSVDRVNEATLVVWRIALIGLTWRQKISNIVDKFNNLTTNNF
jgi:hypothetical protein